MKKQIFLLLILFAFSTGKLSAQLVQWAKQSKGNNKIEAVDNFGHGIIADNNGNVYVTGSFRGESAFDSIVLSLGGSFLVKYNSNGKVLWAKQSKGKGNCGGSSIALDKAGNSYVTGYFSDSITFDGFTLTGMGLFIVKYDVNGNVLWVRQNKGSWDNESESIFIDSLNNTYITGHFRDTLVLDNMTVTSKGRSDLFIAKFDYNGNLLWLKQIESKIGNYLSNYSLGVTIDKSDCYITGIFSDTLIFDTHPVISNGSTDIFVAKYDTKGNFLWVKQAGGKGSDVGNGISLDNNGNSYVIGYFSDTAFFDGIMLSDSKKKNFFDPKMFIAKYSPDGKIIWVKQAPDHGFSIAYSVKADKSGNSFVYGYTGGYPNLFVKKYDTDGNALWVRQFEKGNFYSTRSQGNSIDVDNSGNIYITGYFSETIIFDTISLTAGFSDSTDMFVAKIRDNANVIKGCVFKDINNNGIKDIGEPVAPEAMIEANPGGLHYFTNDSGIYFAYTDTGSFTITVPHPPTYTIPPLPHQVNFNTYGQTDTVNLACKVNISCPLMWVDVSTSLIRACRKNTYAVNYCNKGTADAANSSIRIEFDKNILPFSSTLLWSAQNGNVYTFNLGTVAAGQCGTFYITDSVSCDAVMGSTVCVKAKIFPDTICTPQSSAWDKSNLTVNGTCVDDSIVRFVIQNTGQSMTGNSNYRIYTNNYLTEIKTFQLAANDSIVISLQGKGNTIRLEADQRSGHPGKSHPRATVEACGVNDVFAKTLGLFNTVPQDDADDFVEMDCQEVKSSYDPNEKTVNPTGNGIAKCITPTNELEYQINFQNTGNDTAFIITVRDTLPKNLDISTLVSGCSSHPYSFRIYGEGIMEWTFNNILLPDSTTNETASHGFVKYRVQQKVNNPNGTVISNRAAIYFDYNFPVVTNAAINTVDSAGTVSIKSLGYSIPEARMHIYPNPFNNNTTISIDNKYTNEKTEIVIYDIVGKRLKSYPLQKGQQQLNISSEDIGYGIYICRLEANGRMLAMQKMVVLR